VDVKPPTRRDGAYLIRWLSYWCESSVRSLKLERPKPSSNPYLLPCCTTSGNLRNGFLIFLEIK
jgi:hypothetical protein